MEMTATTTRRFNVNELEYWVFKGDPWGSTYFLLRCVLDLDYPYQYIHVVLDGDRVLHTLGSWSTFYFDKKDIRKLIRNLIDTSPFPEYYLISRKIAVMDLRFKKRWENKHG